MFRSSASASAAGKPTAHPASLSSCCWGGRGAGAGAPAAYFGPAIAACLPVSTTAQGVSSGRRTSTPGRDRDAVAFQVAATRHRCPRSLRNPATPPHMRHAHPALASLSIRPQALAVQAPGQALLMALLIELYAHSKARNCSARALSINGLLWMRKMNVPASCARRGKPSMPAAARSTIWYSDLSRWMLSCGAGWHPQLRTLAAPPAEVSEAV